MAQYFYYASQSVQTVLFTVFIFIKAGAFNGFTKIPLLVTCDLKFCAALAGIESVGYIGSVAIGVIGIVLIKRHYGITDPKAQ